MKYASAFIQSAKRDNLNSPSIEFQINNSPLILIDSPGNRDYTKSLMQSVSIVRANLAFYLYNYIFHIVQMCSLDYLSEFRRI